MGKGKQYQPRFLDEDEMQTAESPEPPKIDGAPKDGVTKQRSDLSRFSSDENILDIWERRMLNPDVRIGGSHPIRIKTPGFRLRWINCAMSGRYYRAREFQGWVPVEKVELVDPREINGVSYTTEGYVCRGERMTEMLMKMPVTVYKRMQARRAELNKKSYEKIKETMGSDGARHFAGKYKDSEAERMGEAVQSFKGNINFGSERVVEEEGFTVDGE